MTVSERASRTGGRTLRLSTKVLPEEARGHNRALVLQTLHGSGRQSRADLARTTGLTRVTISDLVSELMTDGLVVELGYRESSGRGKPAILLEIDRGAFQIIGLDLSEYSVFRGAVLDLGGQLLSRSEVLLSGSVGAEATAKVFALIETLIGLSTAPILGIGVGSPGVVDGDGTVLGASNLDWDHVELRKMLSERFLLPVIVVNDANAAVLAEHSFGDADGDMMLVKVGHGVGAGLLLGGLQFFGRHFSAGEIGHVVVGADGQRCSCGKSGCLETWLAAPRLEAALGAATTSAAREAILREAGVRLGTALAPIVAVLDLAEIVLSGPTEYLAGALADAAVETIGRLTMDPLHDTVSHTPGSHDAVLRRGPAVRMSALADDIVLRGAAAMVLSEQLGFS
ncbi:MAG: ROK family transcriptional regulator [Lacisediminihabitans sp.]